MATVKMLAATALAGMIFFVAGTALTLHIFRGHQESESETVGCLAIMAGGVSGTIAALITIIAW